MNGHPGGGFSPGAGSEHLNAPCNTSILTSLGYASARFRAEGLEDGAVSACIGLRIDFNGCHEASSSLVAQHATSVISGLMLS